MAAQNQNTLALREATLADVDLVFNWSNDADVRAQSFSSEAILHENHVPWFEKKLASIDSLFLIAEVDTTPAALVRFESISTQTVIGILLDKKFRGKGLSVKVLVAALKVYFSKYENAVVARIKNTNIASRKAFANAGFTFVKNIEENGWPSAELEITKKRYAEHGYFE